MFRACNNELISTRAYYDSIRICVLTPYTAQRKLRGKKPRPQAISSKWTGQQRSPSPTESSQTNDLGI